MPKCYLKPAATQSLWPFSGCSLIENCNVILFVHRERCAAESQPMPSEHPSKLTLEPGKGTIQSSQSSPHAGDASAIAALGGKPLGANRGTSLNLDWIDQVRVNTSAVERRAATLVTRRTVKKDWQIA